MLSRIVLCSLVWKVVGCTDDEPVPDCDGHGTFVHGHCHCENGYQQTADELGCEMVTQPPPPPDNVSFMPSQSSAFTALDDGGQRVWVLEALDQTTLLRLEVYAGFGGPTQPGSYALDADDTSYKTCGICVTLQTGCHLHVDHYHCERTYMPEAAGAVTFASLGTSAGAALAGDLADLAFREVTIAGDFTTTTVPNGDELALAPWMFDVVLTER